MACGDKSGFHLRSGQSPLIFSRQRGGWGWGQTNSPFLLPPHLGALAELLWHEAEAAVSMVTSHFSSTSFAQHDQAVNWLALKKKEKQNIERKYTVSFLSPLCRLVKNKPNMVHWLLTRIMAGEYALNSCSAGEKLMEGVFGSVLRSKRERGGPRGMDGAAVIVVNSPSVYVSANSLRKETGDILHTVLQTRTGPLN